MSCGSVLNLANHLNRHEIFRQIVRTEARSCQTYYSTQMSSDLGRTNGNQKITVYHPEDPKNRQSVVRLWWFWDDE